MRRHLPILFALLLVALVPGESQAHSGGLDANGCHYEGADYHCHRKVRANPNLYAPVKKSRENICHGTSSPNYHSLKYFIGFETMEACLKSGGLAFGTR